MGAPRERISDYLGPDEWVPRDQLVRLEKTGKYVIERKQDGYWVKVVVSKGVIVRLETRTGEVLSGPHIARLCPRNIGVQRHSGVLIAELVADLDANGERKGQRRLHLFDVIEWEGHSLREAPLANRRSFLETVHSVIGERMQDRVLLIEQRTDGFAAFYDEIVAAGGEGVVIKRKDSRYRTNRSDGKTDAWLRAKPLRSVDYVVAGHGKATKGSPNLRLALWKGAKLVEVMTAPFPKCLAAKGLTPQDCVGLVVEVVGYEIWNSGVVRSGHVQRVRTDKPAKHCTYEAAMKA